MNLVQRLLDAALVWQRSQFHRDSPNNPTHQHVLLLEEAAKTIEANSDSFIEAALYRAARDKMHERNKTLGRTIVNLMFKIRAMSTTLRICNDALEAKDTRINALNNRIATLSTIRKGLEARLIECVPYRAAVEAGPEVEAELIRRSNKYQTENPESTGETLSKQRDFALTQLAQERNVSNDQAAAMRRLMGENAELRSEIVNLTRRLIECEGYPVLDIKTAISNGDED
jgi:DNA repair ATPase RecN